jgi:hypothetical protein
LGGDEPLRPPRAAPVSSIAPAPAAGDVEALRAQMADEMQAFSAVLKSAEARTAFEGTIAKAQALRDVLDWVQAGTAPPRGIRREKYKRNGKRKGGRAGRRAPYSRTIVLGSDCAERGDECSACRAAVTRVAPFVASGRKSLVKLHHPTSRNRSQLAKVARGKQTNVKTNCIVSDLQTCRRPE